MPNIDRVQSELKKEINKIIAYDIDDPRIDFTVSVTNVTTGKDLDLAKVYISCLHDEKSKEIVGILNKASTFIRNLLFKRLKIRTVPELVFCIDDSLAYSYKISSYIDGVLKTDKEKKDDDV